MNKKPADSSDYKFSKDCIDTIMGRIEDENEQETAIRPILHPHGTGADVKINKESIKIVAEILTS